MCGLGHTKRPDTHPASARGGWGGGEGAIVRVGEDGDFTGVYNSDRNFSDRLCHCRDDGKGAFNHVDDWDT